MAYEQGNYNQAAERLYPLRYQMVELGGSDAQVRSGKIIIEKQHTAVCSSLMHKFNM